MGSGAEIVVVVVAGTVVVVVVASAAKCVEIPTRVVVVVAVPTSELDWQAPFASTTNAMSQCAGLRSVGTGTHLSSLRDQPLTAPAVRPPMM